jgi:hypothetical protein
MPQRVVGRGHGSTRHFVAGLVVGMVLALSTWNLAVLMRSEVSPAASGTATPSPMHEEEIRQLEQKVAVLAAENANLLDNVRDLQRHHNEEFKTSGGVVNKSKGNLFPIIGLSVIEDQNDPLVIPIVFNAASNLPKNVPIQLMLRDEELQPHLKAKFRTLESRLIVTILKANTLFPRAVIKSHNKLYTSEYFWDAVVGETAVLFDTTTCFCSGADHTLEEFLKYGFDYIGAPWKWASPKHPEYMKGGNGRLSIRVRNKMLECTRKYKYNNGNEDMWFTKYLQQIGAKVSDPDIGKMFAVEEIPYMRPFGVSYAMRTVPKKIRAEILKYCPEARMLVGYLPAASWIIDEMTKERGTFKVSPWLGLG